ncbi:MAG: DM13 domain-containing protein [Chloroflexi bacterium]|nr:DM13 domain-containing protein [Chloroflexota bacterium]
MRIRAILIFGGSLAVVLTFTYSYWSTVFTAQTTTVSFPGLSEAENHVFQLLSSEQKNAFLNLSEQDSLMALEMVRAALQPNTIVPAELQSLPEMLAPIELAFGEFIAIDAVRWASGNLILYQEIDETKLLRLENFRSAPAPNLQVYLSIAPLEDAEEPTMMAEWDEWSLQDPYIELGPLKGTMGNQNFVIAPEVDIEQFSLVVIYNATYDLLISAAPLRFN